MALTDHVVTRPRCPTRGVRAPIVLQTRHPTQPGHQPVHHRGGPLTGIGRGRRQRRQALGVKLVWRSHGATVAGRHDITKFPARCRSPGRSTAGFPAASPGTRSLQPGPGGPTGANNAQRTNREVVGVGLACWGMRPSVFEIARSDVLGCCRGWCLPLRSPGRPGPGSVPA
jgi:hypothetical protein